MLREAEFDAPTIPASNVWRQVAHAIRVWLRAGSDSYAAMIWLKWERACCFCHYGDLEIRGRARCSCYPTKAREGECDIHATLWRIEFVRYGEMENKS